MDWGIKLQDEGENYIPYNLSPRHMILDNSTDVALQVTDYIDSHQTQSNYKIKDERGKRQRTKKEISQVN